MTTTATTWHMLSQARGGGWANWLIHLGRMGKAGYTTRCRPDTPNDYELEGAQPASAVGWLGAIRTDRGTVGRNGGSGDREDAPQPLQRVNGDWLRVRAVRWHTR